MLDTCMYYFILFFKKIEKMKLPKTSLLRKILKEENENEKKVNGK